jgi:hypothetical protein
LAAKAIAETIGQVLLQAEQGETFVLGMTGVWVRPGINLPEASIIH